MGAIVVVGAVAAVAIAFALWPLLGRRIAPASGVPDDQAGVLRQELEARYLALAELNEDLATGKLSAADHAQLRAEAETAAASLLGRLEEVENRIRPSSASRPEQRQRPARVPAAIGLLQRPAVIGAAATALLLLGLGSGLLFSRAWMSAPSPLGQTGGSGVQQAIRPDPTDAKALLAFGHQALDQGRPAEAVWAYRQVLILEPNNVEAITHTGILLLQSGNVDQALAHLDRALSLDPRFLHALWDKAQILYRAKQDYGGTIRTLEAFLVEMPTGQDADRARAMIAESRARMASARSTGSPGPGKP